MSSCKDATKQDPFLRKLVGSEFKHVAFEDLSVSTATIDVRLVNDANIAYEELFYLLPIDGTSSKTQKRSAGTIFAGRCGDKTRGNCPTDAKTSLKNCMMLWMWLDSKYVNLKVSHSSVHITGCKTADHAAETIRYLQIHISLLHTAENPLYEVFPYCVDFNIHMINYNFSIAVGIDLTKLDLFLNQNYTDLMYSPYNANVSATNMTVCYPQRRITFTLNDNGQISMCVSGGNFEEASENVCKGYAIFRQMLETYRSDL